MGYVGQGLGCELSSQVPIKEGAAVLDRNVDLIHLGSFFFLPQRALQTLLETTEDDSLRAIREPYIKLASCDSARLGPRYRVAFICNG
jgi:hypothetical protein